MPRGGWTRPNGNGRGRWSRPAPRGSRSAPWPRRSGQIVAAADLDALDTALGELRAAGWPAPESWAGKCARIRDGSGHVGQPNLFPRHRVSEVAAFHGVVGEFQAVDRGKLATQPRVRRSGPLAVQVAGQL